MKKTHRLSGNVEIIHGRSVLETDIIQTFQPLALQRRIKRGDIIHIRCSFSQQRRYSGQVVAVDILIDAEAPRLRLRCWRVWYVADLWNWLKRRWKRWQTHP